MRVIFSLIVFLHGIIHLMGFFKAFALFELKDLTLQISKTIGILWLITALLLLMFLLLYFVKNKYKNYFAITGSILSQILIISAWHDAKFGTLLNIVIFSHGILGLIANNFENKISMELDNILNENNKFKRVIVTKEMIKPLPSPVQLWLTNSGVIDKEEMSVVHLKQVGKMKLKHHQKKWSDSYSEQYITTKSPAFFWSVNMQTIPFLDIKGRDLFKYGKGSMLIKIASAIPVVNVSNEPKLNQSTMQRFLLEMLWYPTMALSKYLTWDCIDNVTAKATMLYKGVEGSATYHFDSNGDLKKVSALRFRETTENSTPIECIGEVKSHFVIDGYKIPNKIEVSWMLDSGKFTWFKVEIVDVRVNP
ncbi:MAG: hypothetical protein K0S34_933 [Bacillales bacterium]|jgi:hypothetical protein|nr:hypothetical protein [Bacillales bacterium]